MWYVFSCNSVEHQTLFQSGWFIEGLLSQTLIVHMIRTQKIPFIQSCASWQVTGLTVLIMVIGIIIPFSPFGTSIGLESLPLSYFPLACRYSAFILCTDSNDKKTGISSDL